METIQERIKSRRLQLKLTLEDVANALGVNKTTVMRYESESIKKIKGVPIQKYDNEKKQPYLEYPDGRREYA